MADIPTTSTTLLRDLAADAQHVRWTEFVARYEPMMRAYLQARFPTAEADDLLQETFAALVRVLPDYHYAPDEHGRFRNFLVGILRHKALKQCARQARQGEIVKAMNAESMETAPGPFRADSEEESAYRQSIVDIVLAEFFADAATAPRTKEVFRRVAIAGEAPESVAQSFHMERHAVDQIKARTLDRLRKRVMELEACEEEGSDGKR